MPTQNIFDLVDTWASGGGPYTSIKMNATDNDSGSASLLMDLQVGGASKFKVAKSGDVTLGSSSILMDAVGGSITAGGTYSSNAAIGFRFLADLFLRRRGAANLALGAADAAAPVAQTLSVQSVVAGTSNTAGTNLTITGSQGTGTGAGGSIVFQVAPAGSTGTAQNALATALTIDSTKKATFAGGVTMSAGGYFTIVGAGGLDVQGGACNIYGDSVWGISVTSANRTGVNTSLGFAASDPRNPDAYIYRDAANTLALRNGTAAQRFNVYNTWTTSTNYEAFKIDWITTTNTVLVGTEKGTGGGTARDLEFQRDGTTQILLASGETRIGPGGSPLITFGQSSASTSARFGFFGGAQLVNSTVSGVASLRLTNGALGDFGALQFGGTTSSFPALKRNSTALETKLADDSAYAPHAMQYLDVTDGVTAPASATGRARIYVDTADGDLKVIFADGTVKTIVTDT